MRSIFLFLFMSCLIMSCDPICQEYSYSELPADYFELEQDSGSVTNGDGSLNPLACPEQIDFEMNSPGIFVVQGGINGFYTDSIPSESDEDNYVFQLQDTAHLIIEAIVEYKKLFKYSLFSTSEDYYNCQTAAPIIDSVHFSSSWINCSQSNFVILSPGYYCLRTVGHVMFENNESWQSNSQFDPEATTRYQLKIHTISMVPSEGLLCNNAITLIPGQTFSENEITTNLSNGYLNNDYACFEDSSAFQRSLWYKFIATSRKMMIRAKCDADSLFNPSVELYESCMTPIVSCYDNFPEGEPELVAIDRLEIGAEYYFRVYSQNQYPFDSIDIQTSLIDVPYTEPIASDCGKLDFQLNSTITIEGIPEGLPVAEWNILFDLIGSPNDHYFTIVQSSSIFNVSQFPGLIPGEIYEMAFEAKVYDLTYSIISETEYCYFAIDPGLPGETCHSAHTLTPDANLSDAQNDYDLNQGSNISSAPCGQQINGQKQMWFEFEAIRTNMAITVSSIGTSTFDGVIEAYDACDNALFCGNTSGAGADETLVLNDLDIGDTYYFRIYDSGAIQSVNPIVKVGVTYVPFSELRSQDCGRMALGYHDIIRSNWPDNDAYLGSSITRWQFKFKELEPPYNTYEVYSPNGYNPQYRWRWFAQREPGRTYKVWTRARMTPGNIWGDYGTYCVIGSAAALPEKSLDMSSGEPSVDALESLTLTIYPNPASGSTNLFLEKDKAAHEAIIHLLDLNGKEIRSQRVPLNIGTTSEILRYDINDIAPGIYLVHLSTDKRSSIARLIVE